LHIGDGSRVEFYTEQLGKYFTTFPKIMMLSSSGLGRARRVIFFGLLDFEDEGSRTLRDVGNFY
jgi:hypothetical protein